MFLVSQAHIDSCLSNDITGQRLDKLSSSEDENLVCQKWLRQSIPKRYIFEHMYGELLDSHVARRVLDVGGGLTAFTSLLARQHDYVLVDLLAHDTREAASRIMIDIGKQFILEEDWLKVQEMDFDLVIANDIFPNVDQRLDLFLKKFLPISKKIVVSLTFYQEPRYYLTRRIDADEILCFLAWDDRQLLSVLNKYAKQIVAFDETIFSAAELSVYPNGRQVCLVEFKGDLA